MVHQKTPSPIIFFDSTCILCDASVQFILKHEHTHIAHFAPLGGSLFQELYSKNILTDIPDSLLVYREGIFLSRTEAIIVIMLSMGFYWKYLAGVLWMIPPFLRNSVYDIIAKNRFSWFGKQEHCSIPNESNKHRFHS